MANYKRQKIIYGNQHKNKVAHHGNSPHLRPMVSDEDASRIHGLTDGGYSTDSDSGKSNFDEEYFKNKPGPLQITTDNTVTINSLNGINKLEELRKENEDTSIDVKPLGIQGLAFQNNGYLTDSDDTSECGIYKDYFRSKPQPLTRNNTATINSVNIKKKEELRKENGIIGIGTSYQGHSPNFKSVKKIDYKEKAGCSQPQVTKNFETINPLVHTNLNQSATNQTYFHDYKKEPSQTFLSTPVTNVQTIENISTKPPAKSLVMTQEFKKTPTWSSQPQVTRNFKTINPPVHPNLTNRLATNQGYFHDHKKEPSQTFLSTPVTNVQNVEKISTKPPAKSLVMTQEFKKTPAWSSQPQVTRNFKTINPPVHTNLTNRLATNQGYFHDHKKEPSQTFLSTPVTNVQNVEKISTKLPAKSHTLTQEFKKTPIHNNYNTDSHKRPPFVANLPNRVTPSTRNHLPTLPVRPIDTAAAQYTQKAVNRNMNKYNIPEISCQNFGRNPSNSNSSSTRSSNNPHGDVAGYLPSHPSHALGLPSTTHSTDVPGTTSLLEETETNCCTKFMNFILCAKS